MADLSVMGFLNEETQQEAEYNLKDAAARQSISALQNSVGSLGDSVDAIEAKIPDNASSSNQLATKSDVSAAYKPKGNATLATLPSLVIANLNTVYNMTEDFVTTSDFAEGAGVSVEAGNEVGIINIAPEGSGAVNLKYTVLGGFIDTSGFYNTSETLETDVDGQDKFPFYDFSAGAKRHITFGSIKAKLKEYFDLFYTNLVSPAINGNFAGLDANGNLVDSGKKASDFATTGNAIANTKLIKDTVGWSGKNKLPNSINCTLFETIQNTSQDVGTIKENADGSITVVSITSGQPIFRRHWKFNFKKPGRYVFSIGTNATINSWTLFFNDIPRGTGTYKEVCQIRQGQNKVEFEVTQEDIDTYPYAFINQRFLAGETNTYYPMIYDADILDSTYEPYFGSTAVDWSSYAKTGAVNILPLTPDVIKSKNTGGTWVDNAYTYHGVTFTVKTNNVGYVKGIELSGTPDQNIALGLKTLTGAELKAMGSTLFLSGGISNNIYFALRTSAWTFIAISGGDVVEFSTSALEDNTTYYLTCGIISGENTNGKEYKPMIAYNDNAVFAPYAMNNKEVTEQFPTKYTSTELTITNGTISEGGYCKIGNVVLVNIRLQATETGSAVDILGLPTYTGANKVICSGANFTDDISAYAYITSGGHLFIKASDVVAGKNYVVSGMYLAV